MKKQVIEKVQELVATTPAREGEKEAERTARLEQDENAELARFLLELHDENERQAEYVLDVLKYIFAFPIAEG